MKRKILCLLFLCALLTLPLSASHSFSLRLNGIIYTPDYVPVQQEQMLYLALEDLTDMTYSNYEMTEENTYTWKLQNVAIKFKAESKLVTTNGKLTILPYSSKWVNEVLYVPLAYLDLVNYPYTLDEQELSMATLLPYSTSTDTFNSHTLLKDVSMPLEALLKERIGETNAPLLLKEARKNNQYLAFLQPSFKQELFTALKEEIAELPPLEVSFRKLDLLNLEPHCSKFITYPLKLTSKEAEVTISFNDTELSALPLTTYMPSNSSASIDVSKSLDVMLMRSLYEYYRDLYDLKDDIHFSPITAVQMARSDYTIYKVYSDHLMDQTHTYQVIIYKQILSDKIHYIVDLIMV